MRSRNSFALSPEGKRVVIERLAEGFNNSDLVDHGHGTQRDRDASTFDASRNIYPVWSPDGSKIAFGSNRAGGTYQLDQRASNGTGQDELLFESKETSRNPGIGRAMDGSSSSGFRMQRLSEDIWALSVTGEKKPFPLRNGEVRETQVSCLRTAGGWRTPPMSREASRCMWCRLHRASRNR